MPLAPASPALRVAIIDDVAPLARAIARTVDGLGHTSRWFDGSDAAAVTAAGPFDLLLVDVNLGGGRSGVELASAAIAAGHDGPVVFMTGGTPPDLAPLPDDGVYAYLTKDSLDLSLATTIALVTRQHAGHKRLRQLERRQRALVEQAAIGLAEVDLESGRLIEASHRCTRVFGCDLERLLAVSLVELFAPDEREPVATALRAVRQREVAITARLATEPPTFAKLTLAPLSGDGPAHAVVMVEDVTSATLNERDLRRQQRLLEASQRISHVGSYSLSLATGELVWSDEMRALHGYDEPGFRPSLEALWQRIHPGDLGPLQAATEAATAAEFSGEREPFHYRVVLPDGSVRHLHGRGERAIDDDGDPILFGVVRDVTREHLAELALRQNKARYRSVFEHATGGIVWATLDGVIVDANPSLVAIVGCRDRDELIGTDLASWFVDPSIGKALDLAQSRPGRMLEVAWRRKDGRVASVLLDGLVLDQDGAKRYLGFVRDLTSERERMVREREAVEASQAKTAFLAGMSHELRTPLNAILGLSEALLERTFGEISSTQETMLSTIHGSGKHLLALINDVLDIARVESGQVVLDLERVRVRDPIDESVALVHGEALRKGVKIRNELSLALPKLELDKRRMKQVFINLLGNAVKFSPPGATVTVRGRHDDRDDRVVLEVADTGPGIPVSDRERVFEPFVTLDPSLTREHNGAGLGLALVRRIVDLHGGRARVEGEVGRGSTFVIELPVRRSPMVETMPPPFVEAAAPIARVRQTVLLVEDQEINIVAVQAYLENQGYEVRVARDGLSAVDAALAPDVSVILMDVRLPGIDGLEATRRIRATPAGRDKVVIALTAHAMAEDEARCLDAGADAYLAKPVRLRGLRDLIVELSARRRGGP